ncbi:hypothetical protein [Acinetobacter baumannii]|uniref:hypothetical protein n=1 Tax=Acinetobacter baumannii TaxID=470 RepID=UPI0014891C1C|nr:hypothetical protein [Acinetobacter baumannii]
MQLPEPSLDRVATSKVCKDTIGAVKSSSRYNRHLTDGLTFQLMPNRADTTDLISSSSTSAMVKLSFWSRSFVTVER